MYKPPYEIKEVLKCMLSIRLWLQASQVRMALHAEEERAYAG
jgi:hypothetical protein